MQLLGDGLFSQRCVSVAGTTLRGGVRGTFRKDGHPKSLVHFSVAGTESSERDNGLDKVIKRKKIRGVAGSGKIMITLDFLQKQR